MNSSSGGSRLEKLLALLEGGTSAAVRKAAGRQIANIAAAHPAQLPSLLRKVSTFTGSKTWDTRVAAGECLGLIAEHCMHHTPKDLQQAVPCNSGQAVAGGVAEAQPANDASDSLLSLDSFSVKEVLEKGTALLASAGQEFDEAEEAATAQERLVMQRRNLKKRLGLGGQMDALLDTADLVNDEDLLVETRRNSQHGASVSKSQQGASELLDQMAGLSARERNKLKRQMKRSGSARLESLPSAKRTKAGPGPEAAAVPTAEANNAKGDAEAWKGIVGGSWPFQALYDQLCLDVLHVQWEVRHGAAVAVREILRSHAGCAAVHSPVAPEPTGWAAPGGSGKMHLLPVTAQAAAAAAAANQACLEDCVVRLLCVLALDRFGDFVSDQVVAPVRETAAQALGATLRPLPASALTRLIPNLQQLVGSKHWEVRHGGLLGLKYLLAARPDLGHVLLPLGLPAAMVGFQDRDDDVRAVSAEALVPVAAALAASPEEAVAPVRSILWDILLDVEELSPSTGSVMQLLTHLHSHASPGHTTALLPALLPRLWPFFRHTLSSVRLAVVRCVQTLVTQQAGSWPGQHADVLASAFRLTFQNLLLEDEEAVMSASQKLWKELLHALPLPTLQQAVPQAVVAGWFDLAATPEGHPLDACLMLATANLHRKGAPASNGHAAAVPAAVVGGEGTDVMRMRLAVAKALGQLAYKWQPDGQSPVSLQIMRALMTQSATWHQLGSLAVVYWAREGSAAEVPPAVKERLLRLLAAAAVTVGPNGAVEPYLELAPYYAKMRLETMAILQQGAAVGWDIAAFIGNPNTDAFVFSLTPETASVLARAVAAVPQLPVELAPSQQQLAASAANLAVLEGFWHGSVAACVAAAVVQAGSLPAKLNGVVQPLMGSLRKETDANMRAVVARALAELLAQCIQRKPSPNDRVVKNLCTMACGDVRETPQAATPDSPDALEQAVTTAPAAAPASEGEEDPAAAAARLARQGAEAALTAIATRLGPALIDQAPRLWELMTAAIDPLGAHNPAHLLSGSAAATPEPTSHAEPQQLIEALQILKVVGPALDSALLPALVVLLPSVCACCRHPRAVVQAATARCAAALAAAHPEVVIPALLRYAVPMLEGGESDDARRGGVALIAQLVMQLNTQLVAYSILLVVPLMGRMSDPLLAVRRMATAAFAAVVALLPLAQGLDAPSGLSEQQVEAWQHDRGFLAQLLDNSKVEDYVLPVKIAGELRRYQQEGISWLAFLRRCGLHGILADDMGLGKTLQATAIMAASAVERRGAGLPDLPSLIVCPPTLVGHWAHEIVKFVDVLRPLAYQGPPAVRAALRSQVAQHNVVVMSYDSLRSDIDWVEKQAWQYCVLDEGHIIRNPKSMITKACKRVVAQHRVLLSGTPIQNNVLELWSLFDFLMPGFLGSEESFNALYGKALRVAKVSKRGSKEAQAGLLAVEGLHKKIMPFVMRRTKDAVLKDLPPKIIQDVYCDASPLQQRLYEDFAESEASKQIAGALTEACGADSTAAKAPHVFQALQYLRKLCSHPLLVLNPAIPAHQAAVEATLGAAAGGPAGPADWGQALPSLRALQHAPKLLALKELLQECGIGMDSSPGSAAEEDALAEPQAGHRVLVFAQLKSFLDLVERDVLRPLGVTFLRLDGSVEATQRFSLVQRFNGDPTVEVMLLTTHVGGLGLNLTAADTVIFLEHDWNPMKDLQAMDRAHRLGQKCTVNVYRLLMRNTLEEKIMGLQRFKLDVAAAVVNQDNVSLATMDAGKLLDLFSLKEGEKGGQRGAGGQNGAAAAAGGASAAAGAPGGGGKAGQGGMKAVLENLEELWDESQYAEEFSLDGFMSKLK